ncbi:MAG: SpoIIE family protein phosphatase [Bdellovibrionales bacterium]|nr:SpoIIE family protein phosphatase [Bdellovibrionales bacterium]
MSLADKILLVRVKDQKLVRFLEKVGYELIQAAELGEVQPLLETQPFDAVIFDGIEEVDSANFIEFIKSQPKLRELPVFFFADDSLQLRELALKHLERVIPFEKPYSIGSVASKIATELRLRKFAGEDEATATLSEVNASLRDLTARLKKDLEEARSIQQTLLPKKLPGDKRYDLAASYEPLEEVGGDWFFVMKTDDEKVSVQIADVTGHGLSAAFIGSMTKLAMMASQSMVPHALLTQMNTLMAPQMPEGKFVTMFSYLYDPATGTVQYARAGHPPGLLLKRKSNEVVQLLGDGFAVGFFEEAEYSDQQAEMDIDDILIVYTDAFPESLNMNGETYGTERMEEFLKSLPPETSSADTIAKLIAHFEEFRGGRILKDDVTIVALRRKE